MINKRVKKRTQRNSTKSLSLSLSLSLWLPPLLCCDDDDSFSFRFLFLYLGKPKHTKIERANSLERERGSGPMGQKRETKTCLWKLESGIN